MAMVKSPIGAPRTHGALMMVPTALNGGGTASTQTAASAAEAAMPASLQPVAVLAHQRLFGPRQLDDSVLPQRKQGKPDGDGRFTPFL